MCQCVKAAIGNYGNQITVPLSWWMCSRDGDRLREFVCIDRCIYDEVLSLWMKGITTTGCCGHNGPRPGYIGVHWKDIERMKSLGYEVQENELRSRDEDSFYLKSEGARK